jgi:hypothetical protein
LEINISCGDLDRGGEMRWRGERAGKGGDGTDLEGSAEDAEFDERHGYAMVKGRGKQGLRWSWIELFDPVQSTSNRWSPQKNLFFRDAAYLSSIPNVISPPTKIRQFTGF